MVTVGGQAWTLEAMEARLRAALAEPLPGPVAQQLLAPVPRPGTRWPRETGLRLASVLLLLYPGPGGPTTVLTVRAGSLAHHGGQVSLPGGGVDDGESVEQAALREAAEEIGVDPSWVRVIGRLTPLHIPVSGNALHPVVGVSDRRPEFRPDLREVEQIVEVPISALVDPARLRREQREHGGIWLDIPFVELDGHILWGATAMVFAEFLSLIGWRPVGLRHLDSPAGGH